jgi:hypothetical protein
MTTTIRPSTTNQTHARLIRLGGLSAVFAGLCYVIVGVLHPENAPASVTTGAWAFVHVIACVMCIFGVFGMTGLYARQAEKSGWLGLAGYVLLSLWLMIVLGYTFIEAFVLPHSALATPAFVDSWMGMLNSTAITVDLGILPTLWTLAAPIYLLGGVMFGIATFRARVLPRAAGVLLAIGTALTPVAAFLPLAAQPKIAIPVGLALVWLGYAVLTERATAPAPLPVLAVEATS